MCNTNTSFLLLYTITTKLSLACLLVILTIALASQSSIVLAEEAAVTSDAGDSAEVTVEDAVEAAVDGDGNAGKECTTDLDTCMTSS